MNKRGTKLNGSSGMDLWSIPAARPPDTARPTVLAFSQPAVHDLYTNNYKIKNKLNLSENSGSITAFFLLLPKLCAL